MPECNRLRLTSALLSRKKCTPKIDNTGRVANCRRFIQNLVASSSQSETSMEVGPLPRSQKDRHVARADPDNGPNKFGRLGA